jgi:hypothetical protein
VSNNVFPDEMASRSYTTSRDLTAAELQRLMVAPTHRVRHYTCVRVTDWGGELVLSQYLRFEVANGRLFCELSRFLLLPLNAEMHRSDGLPVEPGTEDMLRLAWRALVLTPILLLRSPYAVALRPRLRERRRAKQRRDVERDFFFDYGAAETVLDRVRARDYTRYFQMLDKEMYAKVLERAILDAVVGVLEAHDIDPGELVERRSMLVNNGLMVHGGVKAENVAVGTGAAIQTKTTAGSTTPLAGGAGST